MKFKMPPEWEKHERTIIEWPVKESMVWPDNYDEVCNGYAEVICAIAQFEPVLLIVNDIDIANVKVYIGDHIDYQVIPHNDAWCRDNGPTFVRDENGTLVGVDWQFNAWGEKYRPYNLDNDAAKNILSYLNIGRIESQLILEGGAIHVDGNGTLLTTEECLLNPNRNPNLRRDQIARELKDKLGISNIIWLKKGLFGDETDGHIDNVACFADAETILVQTCDDPNDVNYERSCENLKILKYAKNTQGKPYHVIKIPTPSARFYNGNRLVLSYLNFYIINEAIVLPIFGGDASKMDLEVISILKSVFKTRAIICVDGMKLIKEGGNVHCITQQMPLRRV